MKNIDSIRKIKQLYDELQCLEEQLKYLVISKQQELENVPDGKLHVSERKGKTQFTQRNVSPQNKEIYIRKGNQELIKGLAQKEYDQKVLRWLVHEEAMVRKLLNARQDEDPLDIYHKMNHLKRQFVTPIFEDDAEFVQNWQNVEYPPMEYPSKAPLLLTNRGEYVRSKSEVIIANALLEMGVPYRYEFPLQENGIVWARPDFTTLNVRERKVYYWEHFGMMDDAEYSGKAIGKISKYEQRGYFQGRSLILTYETSSIPINILEIKQIIKEFLL